MSKNSNKKPETTQIWAENLRMVDIEINAYFYLFLNLKTNLILK